VDTSRAVSNMHDFFDERLNMPAAESCSISSVCVKIANHRIRIAARCPISRAAAAFFLSSVQGTARPLQLFIFYRRRLSRVRRVLLRGRSCLPRHVTPLQPNHRGNWLRIAVGAGLRPVCNSFEPSRHLLLSGQAFAVRRAAGYDRARSLTAVPHD